MGWKHGHLSRRTRLILQRKIMIDDTPFLEAITGESRTLSSKEGDTQKEKKSYVYLTNNEIQ